MEHVHSRSLVLVCSIVLFLLFGRLASFPPHDAPYGTRYKMGAPIVSGAPLVGSSIRHPEPDFDNTSRLTP